MTLRKWHAAYTACAAADLSHMTDRLTDTANIGNNSQHLMHSRDAFDGLLYQQQG